MNWRGCPPLGGSCGLENPLALVDGVTFASCLLFFASGAPERGEEVSEEELGAGLFLGILFIPAVLAKESWIRGILIENYGVRTRGWGSHIYTGR